MIGRSGESGSGISVLAAGHDDDDDDFHTDIYVRDKLLWMNISFLLFINLNMYLFQKLIFSFCGSHTSK